MYDDDHDHLDDDLQELLTRFSQCVAEQRSDFFDEDEFIDIIDYYLSDSEQWTMVETALEMAQRFYPNSFQIKLLQAQYLTYSEQTHQALVVLYELMATPHLDNETKSEILFNLAQNHYLDNRPELALKKFDQSIAADNENSFYTAYDAGIFLLHLNDPKNAFKYLQMAHKLQPDDKKALKYLVICCVGRKKPLDIIDYANRYLDLDPFNASIWTWLGMSYEKIGNPEKALEAYDYALAIAPLLINTLRMRAILMIAMHKEDEILAECKSLNEENPQNAELHLLTGRVYRKLERDSEALLSLQKAYQLSPHQPDICTELGYNYLKQHDQRAIFYFQEAVHTDPNDNNLRLNLGMAYQAFEKFEPALQIFDELLTTSPENEIVRKNKTISLLNLARYDEAALFTEETLKIYPNSFETIMLLSCLYTLQLKSEKARNLLAKAKDLYPGNFDDFLNQLHTSEGMGDDMIELQQQVFKYLSNIKR